MKFQVSVLSDKGVKKVVAVVEASRYQETTRKEDKLLFSRHTRMKFMDDPAGMFYSSTLVASILLDGPYVVERA